jgi:3-methyladenine DNA glycosylase AlkD
MKSKSKTLSFLKNEFISMKSEYYSYANEEDRQGMAKYMKYKFDFIGLKKPIRGPLDMKWMPILKPNTQEELKTTFEFFWGQREREFHHFGMEMIFKYQKLLDQHQLPWVQKILQQNSWWDSIDPMSYKVVGKLLLRFPELEDEMDQWIRHEDFWIRRTALIFQLMHKEKTDWPRLKSYCLLLAHEKEFFIRKALGWALRQYSRIEADTVISFVENTPELQNLSKREALRYYR